VEDGRVREDLDIEKFGQETHNLMDLIVKGNHVLLTDFSSMSSLPLTRTKSI
jgi:hypothetical protein